MDWENYRMPDGTFNFHRAFVAHWGHAPSPEAMDFVVAVDELREIKSRQMAALLLVLMKDKS